MEPGEMTIDAGRVIIRDREKFLKTMMDFFTLVLRII